MFGGGGFFDWFKKTSSGASKARDRIVSGFDKKELNQFMQMGASFGAAKKRQDVQALNKTARVSSQANTLDTSVTQDQMESLVKAFRLRQDEVFSRRAAPGVASQTRFM